MVEPLYDKKVICLCCGNNFATKKMRQSKIVVNKKDSDFCTYYEGENPLFYEISVCPQCGFAFSENFTALKPAMGEVIRKEYVQNVNGKKLWLCDKRSLEDALKSFKLALICASLTDQSKMTVAGICMRIAWLYRYQNNKNEEHKYLAKAAALYENAYITGNINPLTMSENKLLYMIGELHGRLGNYEVTKKWFNILLSKRNIEPAINVLARDQWAEYKVAIAR